MRVHTCKAFDEAAAVSYTQTNVTRVGLAVLLLVVVGCTRRELRGQQVNSDDGKTYLVIAESPGCATFRIDGRPWPHSLGSRGVVRAGTRRISCSDGSNEIQFEVKSGTTFRFDYWGP
jgi:hypothetical protein